MIEKILNYATSEHLFHFILTILIITFYFITFNNGKPSGLLENMSLVSVTFWFIGVTNRTKLNEQDIKIQALDTKISTNEMKKAQT